MFFIESLEGLCSNYIAMTMLDFMSLKYPHEPPGKSWHLFPHGTEDQEYLGY